jgi:hypothetical protein
MNDNIPRQQYDAGQQWLQAYSGQEPEPRRKHPIAGHIWRNFFRYFFFAVQAIFLIWLTGGLGSTDAGNGIGVGLIIGLWVAVDVILGTGRIVVLFGRRYSGAHR